MSVRTVATRVAASVAIASDQSAGEDDDAEARGRGHRGPRAAEHAAQRQHDRRDDEQPWRVDEKVLDRVEDDTW